MKNKNPDGNGHHLVTGFIGTTTDLCSSGAHLLKNAPFILQLVGRPLDMKMCEWYMIYLSTSGHVALKRAAHVV